jgi:hypothetical protein
MEQTINLIGMKRAADLLNAKPKDLRASLLGIECTHNLLVVDLHWADRAIDAEVGDSILLPSAVNLEGGSAEVRSTNNTRTVVTALSPGIARVSHASGWCAFIRVMRKDYVGLAPLRFDEEVEDVA